MSAHRLKKRIRSLSKKWKAHKYQLRAVAKGITHKYLAYFLDPGLGKTSIILQLFKILQAIGLVKAMIVIAPLRPCYLVWPKEVKKWSNFNHLSVTVLHSEWKVPREISIKEKHDIYVINPEGLPWLIAQLKGKRKVNWPFDMLVVDESTKFKNMSSLRFRNLRWMLGAFKRRYILTGTPIPNGLRNIQGQMAIVDQGQTFGTVKSYFYHDYFKRIGRPEWNNWIPKDKAAEKKIYKKCAPFVMRMKAADYLELPEKIINPIRIKLPRKAQKYYNEMEKELFTLIETDELNASTTGVARGKCHQIANGCIYKDEDPLAPKQKKREFVIVHEKKLDALEDLIEELDEKPLLIGYNFKHDLIQLQKRFKGIKNIGSGVSMNEVVKIEKDWNKGKIPLLAAYPGSAALGLNLQEVGQDVFFYSLIDDFENYDQFILRVLRQGNDREFVRVHQCIAEDTVDEAIVMAFK